MTTQRHGDRLSVLVVSQYYLPETAMIASGLAEGLEERGHAVRVLTSYPNYPQGRIFPGYRQRWRQLETINGVEVRRVPMFIDWAWMTTSPNHLRAAGISDIVFIDDAPPSVQPQAAVVGTISDFRPGDNDVIICAVGAPTVRQQIVESLRAEGFRSHTFVDDRAVVASDVQIGVGSVVCPGSVLSAGVKVGAHAHVNFNCSVGHDAELDDFSTLSPTVTVMGGVHVGQGAFLGGSSTVLPRLNVGRGAVVGAGAVVLGDVEDGWTVVGVPARAVDRHQE